MTDLDDKIDALVEEKLMSKIEEIINLSMKLGDVISEHVEATIRTKLDTKLDKVCCRLEQKLKRLESKTDDRGENHVQKKEEDESETS